MKRRIARDRRRAGVRVVLGQRDEALLRALARFRIARTSDLTGLFFRGVRCDTAATRLRRLHDAGFIAVRVGGLNEPNVYLLGPEGLCWAEERGIATGPPPAGPAVHHLAVVRAWTSLAAALATDRTFRLLRFEPDWQLRASVVGSGVPVVPDAAIEIVGRQPGSHPGARIVLEVDLTTERMVVLQRKLAAYNVSHYFTGNSPVDIAVVLFGAHERRASSVRTLLAAEWSGHASVFQESDWPGALLQQLCEPSLADTHNGKGRTVDVTLHGSVDSHGQGEGFSPSDSSAGGRGSVDTPDSGSADGE